MQRLYPGEPFDCLVCCDLIGPDHLYSSRCSVPMHSSRLVDSSWLELRLPVQALRYCLVAWQTINSLGVSSDNLLTKKLHPITHTQQRLELDIMQLLGAEVESEADVLPHSSRAKDCLADDKAVECVVENRPPGDNHEPQHGPELCDVGTQDANLGCVVCESGTGRTEAADKGSHDHDLTEWEDEEDAHEDGQHRHAVNGEVDPDLGVVLFWVRVDIVVDSPDSDGCIDKPDSHSMQEVNITDEPLTLRTLLDALIAVGVRLSTVAWIGRHVLDATAEGEEGPQAHQGSAESEKVNDGQRFDAEAIVSA